MSPKSDQGINQARYAVIPRTLIFLTHGEQLLLLKGAPNKRLWANLYNGIGGHVERAEDALTAAHRELREETGIDTSRLHLCGSVMIDAGQQTGICLFVFRGAYEGGELVASHEGNLEWIAIDRIADYALVEDLYMLLPRVFAWQPGEIPFFAHYTYDENDRLQITFTS